MQNLRDRLNRKKLFTKYGVFIPIIFTILLLFVIFDTIQTYQKLGELEQSHKLVNHTYDVRLQLRQLLATSRDVDRRERNYLVSGDSSELKLYTEAMGQLQQSLTAVENLTKDNSSQQERIKTLRAAIAQRLSSLQNAIQSRQSGDVNALTDTFSLATDDQERQKIQDVVGQMEGEEQQLIIERENNTKQLYNVLYTGSSAAGVLNIGLVIFASYIIRNELKRRNEMDTNKDNFINMASHELKTPITSLKIYTSMLKKRAAKEPPEKLQRYVGRIDEQTDKIVSLITDLLDISRIETGKMKVEKQQFSINELIEETVDSLQTTTTKHKIFIKGKIRKFVYGDRYRIYQVLVNLLTNAIKYSPDGGKIIVQLQEMGTVAMVGVKDQGIGIEEKHKKKIFDRLYQVPENMGKSFSGLGIGLYVSSEIVKLHGGKIWVDSDKNKGSTFYFTLPFAS